MKSIRELLDFISITHNFKFFWFIWLQNSVSLNYFENWDLILCKCCVFCWNLCYVFDDQSLSIVFQYFNISKIDVSFIYLDFWSLRISNYCDNERNMITFNLYLNRNSDVWLYDFSFKSYLNHMTALWLNNPTFHICFVYSYSFWLLILW